MFGDIKKQFCLRWDEIVLVPGLELGVFLLGELMMVIAVYGMGEKDSIFPLGTVMAIVVPGMQLFFPTNTVIGFISISFEWVNDFIWSKANFCIISSDILY